MKTQRLHSIDPPEARLTVECLSDSGEVVHTGKVQYVQGRYVGILTPGGEVEWELSMVRIKSAA